MCMKRGEWQHPMYRVSPKLPDRFCLLRLPYRVSRRSVYACRVGWKRCHQISVGWKSCLIELDAKLVHLHSINEQKSGQKWSLWQKVPNPRGFKWLRRRTPGLPFHAIPCPSMQRPSPSGRRGVPDLWDTRWLHGWVSHFQRNCGERRAKVAGRTFASPCRHCCDARTTLSERVICSCKPNYVLKPIR